MEGRGATGAVASEKLRVGSNASPLIALAQLDLLQVLAPLFADLVIPPAVAREIAPTVIRPAWLRQQVLGRTIDGRISAAQLGAGETEAIGLALELGTHVVALDDRRARRLARTLGLKIVGTAGLLLDAKQDGLIAAVKPSLDALLRVGFFVGPAIVADILTEAGEEG